MGFVPNSRGNKAAANLRPKLGESISSIGTTAVSKSKLCESFGEQWAHARVTGILLGKGANKKIRVRRTNPKDTEDMEYGYKFIQSQNFRKS